MNFIKLTNLSGKPVYLNIEMIGDLFFVEERKEFGGNIRERAHTRIGHLTHNNGGFSVMETPEEIINTLKPHGLLTVINIIPPKKIKTK